MMSKIQLASLLCLVLMAPAPLVAQFEPDEDFREDRNRDEPGALDESRQNVIRGQVITDAPGQLNHPMPIRLETLGQPLETAFTDGNGNFTFENVQAGTVVYVVIEEPGFKPVRERVDFGPFASLAGGLPVIVFMESEEPEGEPIGDPSAVDLNQLTADIPQEAVEAFQRAAEESEKGNDERSVEHLEEAIEIAPDFYAAQNALGVEYQKLDRQDDAIGHFEIAMELNPNAAEPVLSLGILYLQNTDLQFAASKPDEAQESFEKAFGYLEESVEREATSAIAQYYLGVALFKTGAYEQALTRLNRALALNEQLYSVRLMLSNVYTAQRDFAAALKELEIYLTDYPESPQREAVERITADLEQQLSGP